MRAKMLLMLLSIFVAGKATAFLCFNERRQRIHNLPWPSSDSTNAHLGMMDHSTVIHSTFQDLNPDFTAEMMTDVSHVALDFTGFLTPSRLHILSFAILGRLLVLYSDFLPGHCVPPEELAVQTFLLVRNIKDLVKAMSENR